MGLALIISVVSIFMGAVSIGLYVAGEHWNYLIAGLFTLPIGIICTYISLKNP